MKNPFPLIRQCSQPCSAILVNLPITPNQITTASLLLGVTGSIFFISSNFESQLIGSFIFFLSYILDNCDGEVARYKNLTSSFGEEFDTFVDWIVHAFFFATLGYGTSLETENLIWLWVGLIASAGATINYFLVTFILKFKDCEDQTQGANFDETMTQKIIYIFREIFRSDFCFIVILLTIIDYHWLLLPAAAIGTQIYWIMAHISHHSKK